ncbi:CPBP family intramembrane glutamic endopeptidase [Pseudactinotalea sp. HY158]|uniref:CPBP family intramembrane glutamic endopeptidase n=1 Tax=Pseudactinotalea sp. HY158 TaxID=2654547 RepID=UPI00129C578F|nr:CPBP family intramembrane glutamic endopeptidase [Pseudactinotalea sp. HY158]QGH70207.1 CPBP family intramembrane metalloprotease [Pseudactinotalea sp. HY158]
MTGPARELRDFFRAALVDRVVLPDRPVDHEATLRRRVVVGSTIVAGAVLLGRLPAVPAGDPAFYALLVATAAIWVLGAFGSGPIRLGHARTRDGRTSRAMLQGLILGGMLLGVFLLGALAVAEVPALRTPVDDLLRHARYASLPVVLALTAINGAAEELFFRGALFSALPPRWRVAGSTLGYALSTVLSGVPLLTFAALCLGALTGLQRRVTGGVLGPIVSHLVWSIGMLLFLPSVLGRI